MLYKGRVVGNGSSPLARGLQTTPFPRTSTVGIIPARAGFTISRMASNGGAGDHPRSRGVYHAFSSGLMVLVGSSPLARGLLEGADRRDDALGIIPARAGFTRDHERPRVHGWDHPRSRGVYARSGAARSPGSWIIPARAGFTRGHRRRQEARRGSSPLARGLQGLVIAGPVDLGIIPARAGFTRQVDVVGPLRGDHPRSRGVYKVLGWLRRIRTGSSPLARGLPGTAGRFQPGAGIIPARAGFTRSLLHVISCSTDHPRSRGVYGLSPLER